jgi:hypothetical protein
MRNFLGRTYNLKAIADCESGPESELATEAVEISKRFAATIVELVETP